MLVRMRGTTITTIHMTRAISFLRWSCTQLDRNNPRAWDGTRCCFSRESRDTSRPEPRLPGCPHKVEWAAQMLFLASSRCRLERKLPSERREEICEGVLVQPTLRMSGAAASIVSESGQLARRRQRCICNRGRDIFLHTRVCEAARQPGADYSACLRRVLGKILFGVCVLVMRGQQAGCRKKNDPRKDHAKQRQDIGCEPRMLTMAQQLHSSFRFDCYRIE